MLAAGVQVPRRGFVVERTLILLVVGALAVVALLIINNWHAVNVYNNIIGGNGQ